MSVLPDHEIRALGTRLIDPFDPERVQPASYDLTLANEILLPRQESDGYGGEIPTRGVIDLKDYDPDRYLERFTIDRFQLLPGKCILGSTVETLRVPDDLVARVEGKSSIGRLFLTAHVTAGFIDSGFQGQVTLEICNLGPWRVLLYPGMRIAQVNFTTLTYPCERPYGSPGLGSHYQGQQGPTAAK